MKEGGIEWTNISSWNELKQKIAMSTNSVQVFRRRNLGELTPRGTCFSVNGQVLVCDINTDVSS